MHTFFFLSYLIGIFLFIYTVSRSVIIPLDINSLISSFTLITLAQIIRVYGRATIHPLKSKYIINLYTAALEELLSWYHADKVKLKLLKKEGCTIKNIITIVIAYRSLIFFFWTSLTLLLFPLVVYYRWFSQKITILYYAVILILMLSFFSKYHFFKQFIKKIRINLKKIFYGYFLLLIAFLIESAGIYSLINPHLNIHISHLLFINAISNLIALIFIPRGLGFKELTFSYSFSLIYESFGFFCFTSIIIRFYTSIIYFFFYIISRYKLSLKPLSVES